jgi:hypothetical protein
MQLQQQQTQSSIPSTLILVDGFSCNYDNIQGWCTNMNDTTLLDSIFVYQSSLSILDEGILQ